MLDQPILPWKLPLISLPDPLPSRRKCSPLPKNLNTVRPSACSCIVVSSIAQILCLRSPCSHAIWKIHPSLIGEPLNGFSLISRELVTCNLSWVVIGHLSLDILMLTGLPNSTATLSQDLRSLLVMVSSPGAQRNNPSSLCPVLRPNMSLSLTPPRMPSGIENFIQNFISCFLLLTSPPLYSVTTKGPSSSQKILPSTCEPSISILAFILSGRPCTRDISMFPIAPPTI